MVCPSLPSSQHHSQPLRHGMAWFGMATNLIVSWGRWGFGIFEGDNDLDCISDVWGAVDVASNDDLKQGVLRLRAKLWEQGHQAKQAKQAEQDNDTKGKEGGAAQDDKKPTQEELEEEWDWDIDLHSPRFPHLVRDLLNSGVLSVLIKGLSPKKRARWTEMQLPLVLIAYCAMELGCPLPRSFLAKLKAKYHRVGLFDDGLEQMRRACDEYVDGKPYEFVSLGLIDTANMQAEGIDQRPQPQAPGLEPVPSEKSITAASTTATTTDETVPKRRKTETEAVDPPTVEYALWFPPNTCANCGAAEGYGTPDLKRCKACKDTLYCFEGCQKWHWFRHRRHCQQAKGQNSAPAAGPSGEENRDATN